MREMKDSGIEWVGMIPAHWEIIPMKYLIKGYKAGPFGSALITEQLDDEGAILVYTPEHIAAHKAELPSNLYLPEFRRIEMKQFFVQKNDLVFPIVGSLGRSMLITEGMPDGIINQRLAKFSLSSPKIRIEYFLWLFSKSDFYATYMELNSRGAIIQNLTKAIVSAMPVVIPTVCEQQKISSYLDTQCTSLDALSADIQSQIDVLEQYKKSVITEAVTKGLNPEVEMKDSGVDYVGQMNSLWTLTRLQYITTKLNRSFPENAEALICSNQGKVLPRGDNNPGLISDNDNMYQGVKAGDLLIHGMDTWHGAIAISEMDGKCTTVVHVCDSTENKRFLKYYLQMLAFKNVYKIISAGVRQNTSDFRSWNKAGDIYITIPGRAEQDAIADELDRICTEVETIILEKQSQLETIAEYKKSMIYEYVTGKKEVPHEQSAPVAQTKILKPKMTFEEFCAEVGMAARASSMSSADLHAMYEAFYDDNATV